MFDDPNKRLQELDAALRAEMDPEDAVDFDEIPDMDESRAVFVKKKRKGGLWLLGLLALAAGAAWYFGWLR